MSAAGDRTETDRAFIDGTIALDAHDAPEMSIIMTSDGSEAPLARTLAALASVVAPLCPFEVIVVVVDGDEPTRLLLVRHRNVGVVSLEARSSRSAARNAGAHAARGKYFFFVEAGVEPLPGAVEAIRRGFDLFERVGVVGSRITASDGTLLEAGGYFELEHSLAHAYRPQDGRPDAPEALFARECGHVSGASLAIERALFETIGGYDATLDPGLLADADLCVRARRNGRRVVYQPRAIVVDRLAPRANPSPESARRQFLERHGDWLFGPGAPPLGALRRENDSHRLRALYIDDRTPHIDLGAGLPRANSIVNAMAALGYSVTIYPILSASDGDAADRYRDIAPTIEILDARGRDGMIDLISTRRNVYDLLWISRTHNIDDIANAFLEARVPMRDFALRKIVFDTEASFACREAIMALMKGIPIESDRLFAAIRAEAAFAGLADLVVCVSESEAAMAREIAGLRNVAVLGHRLAARPGAAPFSDRSGVAFVGSLAHADSPNVDSLEWFLAEAWPHVAERLGAAARLAIVGEICDSARQRFARDDVQIIGRVDDIAPIFEKVRVAIAPTRFAAGIPFKVHETISLGAPTVITPLLAAEIEWNEGEGFLVAPWQRPEEFADAVCRLHEDEALWTRTRARGLERLASHCDAAAFSARLRDICE